MIPFLFITVLGSNGMQNFPDFILAKEVEVEPAETVPTPLSHDEKEIYQVFLDPRHRTRLYAEVNTPVTKIYKRMGDTFKKGDPLIEFDKRVYEGVLLKAEAVVGKTETEYQAKKQLYDDNIASFFDLKDAEAEAAAAKADLILAKKNLDASVVKAPYDGKVVNLNIEEHELPTQDKELIEIIDDQVLLAKLLLPSILLPKIHKGESTPIWIREINDTVEGKIIRISPVIDPSSSTVKVEAEIDNSNGRLNAGMTGTVTIPNPAK